MGRNTKKTPSLSKDQHDKIQALLFDELRENMFGDGCEDDMIWHGINLKGLHNMTDKELVDELRNICKSKGLTEHTDEEMIEEYGPTGCEEMNLLKECDFVLCLEKVLQS